jgi:drug/metabolite transporter (DMT)-like permease
MPQSSSSTGLATVITNSQLLMAAILAYLFLRERLRFVQFLGLLLGFIGIIVISLPRLGSSASGVFAIGLSYIVLAAGGVAIGNVFMKALSDRVDALVAMAAQSLLGALPLALAATLREQPAAIVWSSAFVVSLIGLALFGTALAYWLWVKLLQRIVISRANAFTFLTPFIGFSIGGAFFGERPGLAAIIGLSLTAAGIMLVEWGGFGPPNSSRL